RRGGPALHGQLSRKPAPPHQQGHGQQAAVQRRAGRAGAAPGEQRSQRAALLHRRRPQGVHQELTPRAPAMRTLYIVRHAKASPALPGMDDFDRPLNEQGMHDAALMAARFAARKEPVDLLVASTAKRTLATARQFSSALGNAAVQGEPRIYMAS